MNKPTQYILCGIPFSGKTTLGKTLQELLGWVHINLDEIKAKKGHGQISDDDVPDKVWKEIFNEGDKKLIKALKSGKNVVNETAWVTREWRDRARKIAQKAGFLTKVIYIKIPEYIARDRWSQNRVNKARYDTQKNEFAEYIKEFEPPTEDEEVLIYDGTTPVDKWIEDLDL